MLFFLLINVKMPTIVGILIFMSSKNFCAEHDFFYNLAISGMRSNGVSEHTNIPIMV